MSEDVEKIFDDYEKKGYTDGLPIIPPTKERVKRMLEWTDRKPDDSLGKVPPSEYEATVESVAVNAVMAGCRPEFFPVVVTEIITLLDRPNLRGALATTASCWPLTVVNGPIAKEIGLHSGWGLLGTGPLHRANLTIGRTMTLILQNVGKSIPGISEKKHLWNLGRIGICFAEAEDLIPPSWDPLHVEKGFEKETSTVTVIDEGRLYQTGVGGGRPSGVFELDMRNTARKLVELHYNPPIGITPRGEASLYICTPSRAKIYADNGWTKQGLKEFFFDNCRSKPDEWFRDYPEDIRNDILRNSFSMEPPWVHTSELVPLFRSPDDLWVVVSGPDGNPSSVWALSIHHGGHPAVIKQIALANGTPAKSVKDFKHK
ncbi:hypothetical protein MUP77_11380 [Candidatus Bathyarchaeota archaeon]|nr:hypothetical protein [Candidatus Bathyarchaeota archaeon]